MLIAATTLIACGGGTDNAEELESLREEVADLRSQVGSTTTTIATTTTTDPSEALEEKIRILFRAVFQPGGEAMCAAIGFFGGAAGLKSFMLEAQKRAGEVPETTGVLTDPDPEMIELRDSLGLTEAEMGEWSDADPEQAIELLVEEMVFACTFSGG